MYIEALPVPGESEPVAEPPIPNLIPLNPPSDRGQDLSEFIAWIQPVMRWDDHIVIDRFGPPLPVDRCCQCNGRADRVRRKAYSSRGSGGLLFLVLFPLSVVSQEYGICKRCARRRRGEIAKGLAGLAGAALLSFMGVLVGDFLGLSLILGGMNCLLLGGLALSRSSPLGPAKRIDNRWIIVKGGGTNFLESLPKSPIAQF